MGYLKDVYDILKDEPEVRQWLGDALGKVWNQSADELGPEPTHVQQIKAEKAFANALRQDEFAERFKDRLSFLGFILARASRAVDLKERGLVLTRFYLEGGALYFPPSQKTTCLIRMANIRYETVQLTKDSSIDIADEYNFYYIKNTSESPKDLIATLDKVAAGHRELEEVTLQKMFEVKFESSIYNRVMRDMKNNTFALGPAVDSVKQLPLTWSAPNEVRNTIADDLLHVLNWTSF